MKPDDLDDLYEPGVWGGRIAILVIGAAIVGMVVLFILSLTGCAASQVDALTNAANGARDVGAAAADVLHDSCTVRYDEAAVMADPTAKRAEVSRLDRVCIPLGQAYDAYRAAHAAIVAALQVAAASEQPNAAELAVLGQDLAVAGQRLSRALAAVGGSAR